MKRNSGIVCFVCFAAALLQALLAGCGGVTMKTYPTAEEQYQEALREYQREHYLKAIDGFQKVIYNFGGASVVDSAQYHLAMAYYLQKDYFVAASEFERLTSTYPGSPFVDDARYMAGVCYYKSSPKNPGLDQEELTRAIGILEDFIIDNPESQLAEEARTTIKDAEDRLAKKIYDNGRMYFRLKYYASADIYFQKVIDNHTGSAWAARALYYQGELRYKQKQYEEALSKFNSFLTVYPDHELAGKARKMLAKTEGDIADASQEN